MKTPAEIAEATLGPWLADLSDYRSVTEIIAEGIEADRAQRAGRLEDLHAYDHMLRDEDDAYSDEEILIVQIDAAESIGRMRIYVNDGRIYDGDPETGDEWSLT